MWKEFMKKIQLQSILVLIITFGIGYFLFKIDNTFYSAAGITGSIVVGFGVLYSFVSFITINLRENYKDIISEYKSTIKEMRSSYKAIQKGYKDTLKFTTESYGSMPENYKRQIEETTSEENI